MNLRKRVFSIFLSAVVLTLSSSPFIAQPQNFSIISYAASDTVNTAEHTPQEIKKYISSHPFETKSTNVVYTSQPSTAVPYAPGTVGNESLQNALNSLNCMRYIAGLQEVSLNSEYTKLAQAAALVDCVNGVLTHTPSRPANMSDELYNLGYEGASHSNMSAGGTYGSNMAYIMVFGYMADSDAYNINRVGHRRWCLNPNMLETGFGVVDNYSAMYAFDRNRKDATETNVCWPARNMPLEYFTMPYYYDYTYPAWSISTDQNLDASKINVTLTNKSTKQTWNFSSSSLNSDFYVNNDGYGKKGCIIFNPKNISYKDGDSFDVKITGTAEDIEYTVNFFSLSNISEIGDVNDDSYVNASDASLVLSEYSNVSTGKASIFTAQQRENGDVNKDGFVDANDASKILEYYSYASVTDNPKTLAEWLG